jgi:hypothetical protein
MGKVREGNIEESNDVAKWRCCKEKNVCVMWIPLFAGTIHDIASMARTVCAMDRPVGIRTSCMPTKRPKHL